MPSLNCSDNVFCRRRQSCFVRSSMLQFATVLSLIALSSSQISEVAAFYCENHIYFACLPLTRKFHQHNLYISSNDGKARIIFFCNSRRMINRDPTCHRRTFWQHRKQITPFRMSTKDDDVAAAQSNLIQTNTMNATTTKPFDSPTNSNSRSSLSRTLVLAIPLMLKFALVLMIKFLTDLVVFPLLFTYRAVRIMKRRVLKIWNHWTSTSTSSDHYNNEGTTLQLENYNVNGSLPSIDSTGSMGNLIPKA
jgi:hypothetical protein